MVNSVNVDASTPASVSDIEYSSIIAVIDGPSFAMCTPQTAPQSTVIIVINHCCLFGSDGMYCPEKIE